MMAPTFRYAEFNQMLSYLSTSQRLPPSLFVTGPPQSGKNLVVSSALEKLHTEEKISTYAKVSCIPASIHVREIFDSIVREVKLHLGLDDDESDSSATNFAELVAKLVDILTPKLKTEKKEKNCVIALSNAEILRQLDSFLLPGFLRLAEQTGLNICVIFVSSITWNRWQIITWATTCPITISLAPYNKCELKELLVNALKSAPHSEKLDVAPDFFPNFVDVILGSFHIVCRSFPQFLRVSQLVLPVYSAPVIEDKVETVNARALMRLAEPHIKQCLDEVNLREDGLTYKVKAEGLPVAGVNGAAVVTKQASRLSVELPFLSKFLLIAAFLASYNPAKSDKKFFVQNCGRIKKRKNPVAISSHKRSSQLLGPKPFPLDRMIAIFSVIVDHNIPPRSKILTQVSSLVSLQLLSQMGSSDMDSIEIPKYKCNVSLDFIRLVSLNVKFEVHKYLYDANL